MLETIGRGRYDNTVCIVDWRGMASVVLFDVVLWVAGGNDQLETQLFSIVVQT